MSKILDGRRVAEQIFRNLAAKVSCNNSKPHLAIILIGDDQASLTYVTNKVSACRKIGFEATLLKYNKISEPELLAVLTDLNNNPDINGIIVQLPLPAEFNKQKIISAIDPIKDVDGMHPFNYGRLFYNDPMYIPATPLGIVTLLDEYNLQTRGKHCVVVGRSTIVGLPLSLILCQKQYNATVTICHSHTRELDKITKQADILISAVGIAGFITSNMVNPGSVVIDVGIVRSEDSSKKSGFKISGDVDFNSIVDIASYITPVPGGVGPMTIASLLYNTLLAFEKQKIK
jgi:methylenetetrahydrofolate dehydrogenase (NADP+)/methenyltetrahydrofolate cyclohydrolase